MIKQAVINWKPWLGQALCYGLFFGLVGYLSDSPSYQRSASDQAMIKLSLQHAGLTLGECRDRSAEELAQLPANMRITNVCPRGRSPLQLDLLINGESVYSKQLEPRGIHGDGLSSIYFRIPVKAGEIVLKVKMKDHLDQTDYPYQLERKLVLKPAQVLVIDFNSQAGEFIII